MASFPFEVFAPRAGSAGTDKKPLSQRALPHTSGHHRPASPRRALLPPAGAYW